MEIVAAGAAAAVLVALAEAAAADAAAPPSGLGLDRRVALQTVAALAFVLAGRTDGAAAVIAVSARQDATAKMGATAVPPLVRIGIAGLADVQAARRFFLLFLRACWRRGERAETDKSGKAAAYRLPESASRPGIEPGVVHAILRQFILEIRQTVRGV